MGNLVSSLVNPSRGGVLPARQHITMNHVIRVNMKKRYLYTLLFGIPGFFIAGIISLFVLGALFGVLWIFIFGDNPWPASTETFTSILFVFSFLVLWIGSMILGYQIGRGLENGSSVDRKHVLISVSVTALFILFIVFQQWNVGNLGPKSDSVVCAEFCTQKGYSTSGMPPLNSGDRSCSCYDNTGHEVLKIPLISITPDASK